MRFLEIDGSMGEGGGQILRSSLSLSMLTGRPVRLSNIRAKRKRPGLMRQHLTCLRAAAEVCDGEVAGDSVGSTVATFLPGKIKSGRFEFSLGTAGSTSLVLQTILPALMQADGPSFVTLEGGTHNPFAPPFDFLDQTFLPVLRKMGAIVEAKLLRPGFFPAGGGRVEVTIEPTTVLKPLALLQRDGEIAVSAKVCVANLDVSIAEREAECLKRRLALDACTIDRVRDSAGPGNVVLAFVRHGDHTEVFSGFGQRGVTAERVAAQVAKQVASYRESKGVVGIHLADQLILPMAMAGSGQFRTLGISDHTSTNIEVTRRFLGTSIQTERLSRGNILVSFGAK